MKHQFYFQKQVIAPGNDISHILKEQIFSLPRRMAAISTRSGSIQTIFDHETA